jgi:hypothetical protein
MNQEITDRREIRGDVSHAVRSWTVTEFDSGHVILTTNQANAQISAHFSAEQWAAFQALVAPKDLA